MFAIYYCLLTFTKTVIRLDVVVVVVVFIAYVCVCARVTFDKLTYKREKQTSISITHLILLQCENATTTHDVEFIVEEYICVFGFHFVWTSGKKTQSLMQFVCTFKNWTLVLPETLVGCFLTVHPSILKYREKCHAFCMIVCWVNIKINWTYNEVFVFVGIYLRNVER